MASKYIPLTLGLFLLLSCNGAKNKKADAQKRQFTPVTIPAMLTSEQERTSYAGMHYWDNFDFSDTSLISLPEVTEQAFVNYLVLFPLLEGDLLRKSISTTLSKAQADSLMFAHFSDLFEKYLYDPNSPLRNEEFYTPYLTYIIDSTNLEEIYKERPKYQLSMVLKNRVGEKANDFHYTTASSKQSTLYKTKAEMVILFFYNPDCENCKEIKEIMKSSTVLSKSPVKIVAIYPDEDLELWKSTLDLMPKNWVVGCDPTMSISKERLYDLRAIPSLYLLDKEKRVLLKDTSIEQIESYLTQMQTN